MRDLVAANFRRMFKNSLFWGGVLFMFFVAVVELVSSKIEVLSGGSSASSVLDSLLYDGALRLAVVMAIFVSVFVGTDYSDGTIRNKIVLGHHRHSIYLANLIVCVSAAIIMQAAHLLALLVPGRFLFHDLTATMQEAAALVGLDMLAINAFTALYLAVCMASRSKSTSAILTLLTVFGATLLSVIIYQELMQPEYVMDNATSELVRNGYYVSGLKRTVFDILNNLLASSQIIQLENQGVIGHIHRFAIYDLAVMGVSTLGGIFAFGKADLK